MALGGTQSALAVKPLIEALSELDPRVRWAAAKALGALGLPSSAEGLSPLLKDRDKDVRNEAAMSMAALGDQRAVGTLILIAEESESSAARCGAVEALGKLRNPLASRTLEEIVASESAIPVEGLLDGSEPDLRTVAAEALAAVREASNT